ncbi:MAG: hypothetical protein A2Y38_14695 [Spirochaetes bacterium GWB1_59_5]|nr:MAG: hypothetical protein A2Y38_14695 [Spirochaetes bacterium GWB1_59_5]
MLGYNDTSAVAVSAAGTTLATATPLRAKFNKVTTAAASTGVSLPVANAGDMVIVQNSGANALAVYPNSATGTIAGGSAGAAVSLAVTTEKTQHAIFICWGSDVWTRVVSG